MPTTARMKGYSGKKKTKGGKKK